MCVWGRVGKVCLFVCLFMCVVVVGWVGAKMGVRVCVLGGDGGDKMSCILVCVGGDGVRVCALCVCVCGWVGDGVRVCVGGVV